MSPSQEQQPTHYPRRPSDVRLHDAASQADATSSNLLVANMKLVLEEEARRSYSGA